MSSHTRVTALVWFSDQMQPRMGEEAEGKPSCFMTEPKPREVDTANGTEEWLISSSSAAMAEAFLFIQAILIIKQTWGLMDQEQGQVATYL